MAMNKKAQRTAFGFGLLVVFFILAITSFALIDPFKEFLDTARNSDSLNCKGTVDFNQTAFQEDNTLEKLTRRPTCFVTGLSMIYFIGAFLIGAVVWLGKNWRKVSK